MRAPLHVKWREYQSTYDYEYHRQHSPHWNERSPGLARCVRLALSNYFQHNEQDLDLEQACPAPTLNANDGPYA